MIAAFDPDQLEPQLFARLVSPDMAEVAMAAPAATGDRWCSALLLVPTVIADDPPALFGVVGWLWRSLERAGARWPA